MAGEWERFQRAFADDVAMQQQLDQFLSGASADATVDRLVEFARSRGYSIGADDAARHFARVAGRPPAEELTDEQLEQVSGGTSQPSARVVPSQVKVLLLSP
jgi:bacteriocin-like protein